MNLPLTFPCPCLYCVRLADNDIYIAEIFFVEVKRMSFQHLEKCLVDTAHFLPIRNLVGASQWIHVAAANEWLP